MVRAVDNRIAKFLESPPGRSTLCLIVVLTSNTLVFCLAGAVLVDDLEKPVWRLFALAVCALQLLGTVFEIKNRKYAKVVNIGSPMLIGVVFVMAAVFWVEPEGAPFLMIFALVPFFLAAVVAVGYKLDRQYLSNE